ncbi:MAG: hypothetical protein IKM20_08925 [Erysipelotrichales bacterium]|nr:hypothetical protein [Erysipelotrichales bacterium]
MVNLDKEKFLLAEVSFKIYDEEVQKIIDNHITDERYIKLVLDYLMDFSYHMGMMFLFRTLLRYYYTVNETEAERYVEAYNEKYGDEERYYYSDSKSAS